MNWESIGVLAEIIGAGAVVVTLAYLAVHIRAQNREARMSAMHEISEAFRESIGTFSDLEKADIIMPNLPV